MGQSRETAGEGDAHSHSRIQKLLDEIDAVVTAAEWNGSFEAHHRRELGKFLERLDEVFEEHAREEETGIFREIRSEIGEAGRQKLEAVLEQHRIFEDHLEALRRRFESLEVGASGGDGFLQEIEEEVESLREVWRDHDSSEHDLFDLLSSGNEGRSGR